MIAQDPVPSSYQSFSTICSVVLAIALVNVIVGCLLFLFALTVYTNSELSGHFYWLLVLSILCIASSVPLLILAYGGRVLLDLAHSSRAAITRLDQILGHMSDLNPGYEERLEKAEEAERVRLEATRRRQAEGERERLAALDQQRAEAKRLKQERLADEEQLRNQKEAETLQRESARNQKIIEFQMEADREFDQILHKARRAVRLRESRGVAEIAESDELVSQICSDIDGLFGRLADFDGRFLVSLTEDLSSKFARHPEFKSLEIDLEPA